MAYGTKGKNAIWDLRSSENVERESEMKCRDGRLVGSERLDG